MHPWHDIELGNKFPGVTSAVIEIPMGSSIQYVLDHRTGLLRLKELLPTVAHYPANIGFFPRTLANDGDGLDAIVFAREPIQSLSIVEVRSLGGITLRCPKKDDESKIIAVATSDPEFQEISSIKDLPVSYLERLTEFFAVYKARKADSKTVIEVFGRKKAHAVIEAAAEKYQRQSLAA